MGSPRSGCAPADFHNYRDTTLTPRPVDTQGLSAYETLEQVWATERYRKAVEFEVQALRRAGLEAVRDAGIVGEVGHVSIRPPAPKSLLEWIASRLVPPAQGPSHEYTELLRRIGKEVVRPPQ